MLIVISQPGIVLGLLRLHVSRCGSFSPYPVAYYFRDCFRLGHWPLWNPYNNCGIPFLAQWNTMTLYPASLIYLLLPVPWSLNAFVLAHLFLAALGMYRLCYYWFGNRVGASVAGLAFAWNGSDAAIPGMVVAHRRLRLDALGDSCVRPGNEERGSSLGLGCVGGGISRC